MLIQFLPLDDQHLDHVWRIEQQAHSHPWKESMIRQLDSRGATHFCMLLDNQVIGYFYAQNIVGEVSLLNIAIDPAVQGKGYGKQLAEFFLEHCESVKAESAWLEVRESNFLAFELYQQIGFNEIDRRVNYYPTEKGQEDAIIMSYYFFH
ncbi:ribosomal protein S18-alanine N-acetyltransferase [Vibrio ziniensis]|uniref:[Ribosomal protein bS18]-alanine N-acetyltransferase n=1 Tax=Vibrio ziniensis TaxID=2711221 RepID=A0A6G7CKJ2_9VIBR|nr:ribosomal protein S18-alanine N-acetyltransferase [Vibrio ziniensis]QIH42604.1 ribosomal protein S18-alanine N-acetyltransferase [Vibrio ziniensis]